MRTLPTAKSVIFIALIEITFLLGIFISFFPHLHRSSPQEIIFLALIMECLCHLCLFAGIGIQKLTINALTKANKNNQ
ncbi:hypothetical protein Krac_2521 [Ktedonobacter racemifer DSM 44963]|uniref:Uncharacterized protein n=1 Tax=Ktedonobacter racemifer DSM 44963 TaxID=485913 RepID=D6TYY4_KTERA|nr:hypothetical protein Krac_2521 [Ktedonobacter racemifer DSM 44963]